MPENRDCGAPGAQPGAVPRTCVPFAHVPAVPVVPVPCIPVPVPSGLPVMSVAGILPDRTGNVDVTRFLEEWASAPLAGKADKATPSAAGNLASLGADGNLADSGATPASIKAAAVAEVVANAPGTMDTLKEIADILGSSQQSGTVLKRISDLETGKVDKEAGKGLVAVDAALATPGAAADAKTVGYALRSGFTEWVCDEISEGWEFEACTWMSLPVTGSGWYALATRENDGEEVALYLGNDRDATGLEKPSEGENPAIVVSRRLVTPTKTSQLTNDGDGANAFVKTNDARLSDARTPTAHAHAMSDVTGLNAALAQKAALSDLPYRLVEPGKWEFSGEAEGQTVESISWDGLNERWECVVSDGGSPVTVYVGDAGEAAVSLRIREMGIDITATRAWALQDRAVNSVSVTGATTLTLPSLVNGKSRDFYLKMVVTGSQQVSFSPSTGITYTGFGDPSKTYSAGTYLLRLTETAENEFCVTDMLTKKQDALSPAQIAAVDSGATAEKVATWDGYAVQIAGKANAADLPYSLVAAQQTGNWQFSGSGVQSGHTYDIVVTQDNLGYFYTIREDGEAVSAAHFDTSQTAVDFSDSTHADPTANITAIRAYALQDRASNVMVLGSSVQSVAFEFPPHVPGKMRDFIVRMEVTGQTPPELTFVEQDGTPVPFDAADDSWAEIEPGVNVLLFADTSEPEEEVQA